MHKEEEEEEDGEGEQSTHCTRHISEIVELSGEFIPW